MPYPVVQTKLHPPRVYPHTLRRPRLSQRLQLALQYRLVLVQAGAGYGKSTALSGLADEPVQLAWYQLDSEDADALRFLWHLAAAFEQRLPGVAASLAAFLEEWDREQEPDAWDQAVDILVNSLAEQMNAPLLLVLDDAHHLNQSESALRSLDRLVGRSPHQLHTILSARYPVSLPTLVTWRVRGETVEIDQEELAFTLDEVRCLYEAQYDLTLTEEQLALVLERIEGWPIALRLLGQRLQQEEAATLPETLALLTATGGDLFTFLAHEVLAQQPAAVRDFLYDTAVLQDLTPALCDWMRQADDSKAYLTTLAESGLFLVAIRDGHARYHHLFRELLVSQMPPERRRALHRRAIAGYSRQGQYEAALVHALAAAEYDRCARILSRIGRDLIRAGRLATISSWLGQIPPDLLQEYPLLLVLLGDTARLHSHFDEALGWYQQAEQIYRRRDDSAGIGLALRGQARVYLDTVNPSKADDLLQEALRLSDGFPDRQSRARLLELLAENMLNRGRTDRAAEYQQQARALREEGPDEAEIPVRMLLRTGRLREARQILEKQAAVEREAPVLRPRAHRETLLLLSIIMAFQGEAEGAYQCALEGTERGQALDSPFVTAVGYMRQGHSWLLRKDEDGYYEARRCFEAAIELSNSLDVPRLKVEASWGLCQVNGFAGELLQAEEMAEQGMAIAQNAGDAWIEGQIRVVVGASYVLAGQYEKAAKWLDQAGAIFRDCADTFGQTTTRLWQCLLWHQTGDEARLRRDVPDLLRMTRQHGNEFLFLRKTLLGPPDPRSLVPLLLFARNNSVYSAYAGRLLSLLGLETVEFHPGYQLRVQVLGGFRLWRGREEVAASDWKRRKARELFLYLITHRERMVEREQIIENLWPHLEPEAALRDYKSAYSTLCNILEPARQRNSPSAYIDRDETRYGLRSEADLWLDAAEFRRLARHGDTLWQQDQGSALAHYREALALYQGDYLQAFPYAEWCSEERERLLTRYLRTAERVAQALVEREAWSEAIQVGEAILTRDNCWEEAYRLLMRAYAGAGNRAQAARVYQQCQERLSEELGVAPAAQTTALYDEIVGVQTS
jgi:ATP/maltotriose-dependent transcriptional regulator MalT/DNA-binding SARP family transcriptional activator